jgi:hypothetical protein
MIIIYFLPFIHKFTELSILFVEIVVNISTNLKIGLISFFLAQKTNYCLKEEKYWTNLSDFVKISTVF